MPRKRPAACCRRPAPTGLVGGHFQNVGEAWLAAEQRHAVGVGILLRSRGQFVDEALVRERVQRVAHRAPVAHAQARVVLDHLMFGRRDLVGRERRLGHQRVLHIGRQAEDTAGHRLRNHLEAHRRGLAVLAEAGGQRVHRLRPVEVVRHVVFARPQQLDRLVDGLGDLRRLDDVVDVDAPAEAAAEEGGAKGHVFGLHAERFRDYGFAPRLTTGSGRSNRPCCRENAR